MKKVILDCEKLLDREQAHLYLAEKLNFPDYYGKNLDALYDCLTELGECTIVLAGESILHQSNNYGARILRVFEEANLAYSGLKLEVQDDKADVPYTGQGVAVDKEKK